MLNYCKIVILGFIVLSLSSLTVNAESKDNSALTRVNERYKKTIRPIFEKKCFDCHSNRPHQPWYYPLPIAKQLIDRDMRLARADMDMSEDFPFLGKGTPADYLDVIEDAVNDGSMPPWRYRIAHQDSALTSNERKLILDWIETGNIELGAGSRKEKK